MAWELRMVVLGAPGAAMRQMKCGKGRKKARKSGKPGEAPELSELSRPSRLAGAGVAGLTAAAPPGPVFHDPIRERSFEADVVAGLFGFDPLMLQDLLSFCLELLLEG